MKRGDVVKVTDTRDGSAQVGRFSGSGDWGMRFTFLDSSFRGFQVDDFEWNHFEFEVIES
jgi:formylglycine-generating enzyme required for sulfatase activity